MGEVYRGRDSRIAREVAVKLLPEALAEDPDRLRRFEQEARAAGALNHPNILAIYDVGSTDGRSYIVFELLEGETLRDRLAPGPLPVRRAVDFALQICNGLAAAHQKGIVHRDLKPENLFLTRDGRVKILDFGLARQAESGAPAAPLTQMPTSAPSTEPGIVMGTVGYMSPEQVRGKTADGRSDVFALGAILHEMLTGRRAFRGSTAADTMSAILREEPADPSTSNAQVPPALDKIVAHCLGKEPEERYQAARDVAFALETFSGLSASSGPATAVPSSRWKWTRTAAVALAGMAVLAAAQLIFGSRAAGSTTPPTDKRLTYRRGFISGARFAPDGQTIVYSAAWDGAPSRIFVRRPEGREATPLHLPNASLLSVSSQGELAILIESTVAGIGLYLRKGTLARVPLSGGSPRQVATDVWHADWSPDGMTLAIVPIGRTLLESLLLIRSPRVSRDGNYVAFWEGLPGGSWSIVTLDRSAGRSAAEPRLDDWYVLSWSPKGAEVWFLARGGGDETPIMAVDFSGSRRILERGPYSADLWDASSDGKALLSRVEGRLLGRALGRLAAGAAGRRQGPRSLSRRRLGARESAGEAHCAADGRG